jgi:Concanavalin A-like lectin/glucanases superfamily
VANKNSSASPRVRWVSTLSSTGGSENKIDCELFFSESVDVVNSATTLNDGKWHHVTCVRDTPASKLRMYVDGAVSGSVALTNTCSNNITNSTALTISSRTDNSPTTLYLIGTIDDVRVYNRALSYQEIQQLYHLGAGNIAHSNTVALSSGLIGYWTLHGSKTNWTANTMQDSSGNGNTGTLVSMSTTTSPAIGKIGGAMKFDGTASYVSVADTAILNPTAVTVSAWVNYTSFASSGNYTGVVSKNDGTTNVYSLLVKSTGKLAQYVRASCCGGTIVDYDGTGTFTLRRAAEITESSWV